MDESGRTGSDGKAGSRSGRSHDAEGTRDTILDSAEKVFAEHGFDGARIDAIAQESGHNKSLIFQYFGDKLRLYAAVIRRADDQTRQTQDRALKELRAMKTNMTLEQLKAVLGDYVGWYFDYMVQNPNIMRIFNWEMAEGWQTFGKVLSERDVQDVEDFAPIFAKIRAAGLMRPEPHPLLQYTAAMFSIHVYMAILPFYHMLIPNADWESPKALAQARKFIIEFVTNGLLVEARDAKRKPSKAATDPIKKAAQRG